MDTLYVKVDDDLRERLDAASESHPFRYRRSDGRVIQVDAYRSVPTDLIDDRAWVATILSGSLADSSESIPGCSHAIAECGDDAPSTDQRGGGLRGE
jgi:hypothetical protein